MPACGLRMLMVYLISVYITNSGFRLLLNYTAVDIGRLFPTFLLLLYTFQKSNSSRSKVLRRLHGLRLNANNLFAWVIKEWLSDLFFFFLLEYSTTICLFFFLLWLCVDSGQLQTEVNCSFCNFVSLKCLDYLFRLLSSHFEGLWWY